MIALNNTHVRDLSSEIGSSVHIIICQHGKFDDEFLYTATSQLDCETKAIIAE